jgi:hypothetical protein
MAACELLTSPDRYKDKDVQIRGVYIQLEHGSFLVPYPDCETAWHTMASIHGVTKEMQRSLLAAGGDTRCLDARYHGWPTANT